MKINKVRIQDFRNIPLIEFEPGKNSNVIYGDNGQGKTNILEALWMFTGNGGFRSSKLSELIRFGQKMAEIQIHFEDSQRSQQAKLKLGTAKELQFNHVDVKKSGEATGHFYCVVFSPTDLELVKGSPQKRRRFMDDTISQTTPQYRSYLETYEKVLEQRNALLKDLFRFPELKNTIEIWDMQLAKLGTILSIYRKDYLLKFRKIAKHIYDGISSQKEELELHYRSTIFPDLEQLDCYNDTTIDRYYNKLQETLEQDKKAGFTTVGIHRDELELLINGISAKNFGSQGQQRSCAVTLKLSEAKIVKIVTGEYPVILLDDVMSELDRSRQDYLLNHLKGQQVLITCCDLSDTTQLESGKIFHIEQGTLSHIESPTPTGA